MNKLSKLKKHLLEVVGEFSEAFGVGSLPGRKVWADGIRRNVKRVAVLPVGGRQNLIWTKEDSQRKLVFQTPRSYLEVRAVLDKWLGMPWTSRLKNRKIVVGFSPHTLRVEDIVWGADEDMLPPELSQGKR